MKSPRVVVVGAGVVGLTTALLVQKKIPDAKVTIIAKDLEGDTLSSITAGIFRPGTNFKAHTPALTKKWIKDSWEHWLSIFKSDEATLAGIMQVSSYIFSRNNPNVVKNHLIEDIMPVYRNATEEELNNLCGGGWKYGSFFTTIKIECSKYLPWATNKFVSQGGKVVKRKVNSFEELDNDYDVIMNCTGLGAKELCGDHDLTPIRGQIIKVKAPWVKTAIYWDYDTYIIPGFDGFVTLGGTRQYDSYNTEPDRFDQAAIMDRCVKLLPALAKAEIVDVLVGLRPHRAPVRVEAEMRLQKPPIVHCYGHGGYGVTCAPGTAYTAVDILTQILSTKHKL